MPPKTAFNQYDFGMKAHIGVDAASGLVHTVVGTAANVHDVTQAAGLLHGHEQKAYGDAGYQFDVWCKSLFQSRYEPGAWVRVELGGWLIG